MSVSYEWQRALRDLHGSGPLLVFILVVWIIYGAEFVVATPLATEPHESIVPALVLILDLAHDVDDPPFGVELPEAQPVAGRGRSHLDFVFDCNMDGFADIDGYTGIYQFVTAFIERRVHWEPGSAEKNPIDAAHNMSLGAADVDDDEGPFDVRAIGEEESGMADMFRSLNPDMPYAQPGAMSGKKFEATNGVLLFRDVSLTTS